MLHLCQHLLVEVQSLLKLIRLLIGLDHSGVDDSVHGSSVFFHHSKDVACPLNVVILHTGLQEASVGHQTWRQACALHLTVDVEGVFELILLTVRLNNDAVGHRTRSDTAASTTVPTAVPTIPMLLLSRTVVPVGGPRILAIAFIATIHLIKEVDGT